MHPGTYTQMVIRFGQIEFLEKYIGHVEIIMLASVDEDLGNR